MWGQSPQRPCEVSRVATTFCSPGRRAEGSLPGQLPGFSYQWLHHTLISKALTEHLASHIPSRVTMLATAAGLGAGHKPTGREAPESRPDTTIPSTYSADAALHVRLSRWGNSEPLSAGSRAPRVTVHRERKARRQSQSRGLCRLGGQIK